MSAGLRPVLDRIARGERLSEAEAEAAFELVLAGDATQAQVGGLLIGLRLRGESADELTGAARAMRRRMRPIEAPPGTIDVCGTGGDRHGTLNVSTAVAFVLAALGVPVAKHGNRAQSSRTGGTDVLAALGLSPVGGRRVLERQIERHRIAFLAATLHHPALGQLAGLRAELGTRTVFNLLGPLCNPASVSLQLVGVFDPGWLEPVARTLQALGARRAWVVHGEDRLGGGAQGLDELTLAGPSQVVALEAGRLHRFSLEPGPLGLVAAPVAAIAGGDASFNAAALEAALCGAPGPYRDTIVLNAAAALRVARGGNMFPPEPGGSALLREAIALAAEALDNGAALGVLEALRADASKNGEEQD